MKPSPTPSCATRKRPLRSDRQLLIVLALLLAAPGCVARAAYQEAVGERDELAKSERNLADRVEKLETSNRSLDAERVRLIDEMEDLRLERSTLKRELSATRQSEQALQSTLSATEEELAAHEAQLAEAAKLKSTYQGLVDDLESEVASGQIQIQQLREGLVVNVSDEILFPSGSASLNSEGRDVLLRVASRLTSLPHEVEVQGHSDNIPIRGSLAQRYPSNWELAALGHPAWSDC